MKISMKILHNNDNFAKKKKKKLLLMLLDMSKCCSEITVRERETDREPSIE
jgi:hypothetical protein